MTSRPVNRECPQEREAALRLLRLIKDPKLSLDDILAHGLILDSDDITVAVGGIQMLCKVDRDPRPPEER